MQLLPEMSITKQTSKEQERQAKNGTQRKGEGKECPDKSGTNNREFAQATGSLRPSQIATTSLICVAQTGKPRRGFHIASHHFIDY